MMSVQFCTLVMFFVTKTKILHFWCKKIWRKGKFFSSKSPVECCVLIMASVTLLLQSSTASYGEDKQELAVGLFWEVTQWRRQVQHLQERDRLHSWQHDWFGSPSGFPAQPAEQGLDLHWNLSLYFTILWFSGAAGEEDRAWWWESQTQGEWRWQPSIVKEAERRFFQGTTSRYGPWRQVPQRANQAHCPYLHILQPIWRELPEADFNPEQEDQGETPQDSLKNGGQGGGGVDGRHHGHHQGRQSWSGQLGVYNGPLDVEGAGQLHFPHLVFHRQVINHHHDKKSIYHLIRYWMMHRWTPFVRHFKERHLGSTIALKLDGMIEQLELTNPDLHKFCVNDNASNMQVE